MDVYKKNDRPYSGLSFLRLRFEFAEDGRYAVHYKDNACDNDWEANPMMSKNLLEDVQGISRVGVHQEHEVLIKYNVECQCEYPKGCQKSKTFGQFLDCGLYISVDQQYNGICNKQRVYREGMEMHEISKRQGSPAWE